ncbi:MAG: M43 family zinc metalloprotease, partial [Bacteroidota bacterium]
MRSILLVGLLLTLFTLQNANAQKRSCSSEAHMEELLKNPEYARKYQKKMKAFEQYSQRAESRALCSNPVVLPMAIHYQGVPDPDQACLIELAQSQVTILNNDYQGTNADISTWINQAAGTFPGVDYGETCIEFCIGSKNHPAGYGLSDGDLAVTINQTNGDFNADWAGYVNVFVIFNTGVLGYSPLGGDGNGDGVVIDASAFGTGNGCGAIFPNPPYNLGRTLTHELGHYLLLRHIWGSGCSVDDQIADTPDQSSSYGGCPDIGASSCGSADMHMNYMDYVFDECMYMFSAGQSTVMENYTNSNLQNLITNAANVCGSAPPPTPTCSDGIQNGSETGVDCGGPDCAPCNTGGCTDVTLTLTLDNYGAETTWAITDGSGATVASGGPYTNGQNGTVVTASACLAEGCYDFTINDSFGDGICCSYGNGNYILTDVAGNTLATGGDFNSSQTTNFCVGAGTGPTCSDGIQNGDETGVDCGGPDCPACPPAPTCTDGVQNGSETGVDCGGPDCPACPVEPTCDDGVQNGNETGVDCGGPDCAPCDTGGGCTDVTLTLVLDNYGSETTWSITDASGSVVASGGPYSNGQNGTTITASACLDDGCYDFTINDSFGDGICCTYGNGSYTVVDAGGTTLASGGNFNSTETTNFCVGGGTGPTPTCNDGVQNGSETGVDCGGPDCAPCDNGGGCTDQTLSTTDFESGFGIWNDGGSDCARINNSGAANSGSFSVRLRDNTASSTTTTDNLALAAFEDITVDFSYLPSSMENGEDFWLQISTNGGSSYTTVATWARGTDFINNQRYDEAVTIEGPFSNNTRVRFRCDASSNADYVYIDDIVISGCNGSSREAKPAQTTSSLAAVAKVD